MTQQSPSRKLLRIHKNDNVLIVADSVQPGDKDTVDGHEIVFTQSVAIGHKVAARLIRKGDKVVKCGVPIGSAIDDIPAGAHIHLHNLQSNYLETYTLDRDHTYVE